MTGDYRKVPPTTIVRQPSTEPKRISPNKGTPVKKVPVRKRSSTLVKKVPVPKRSPTPVKEVPVPKCSSTPVKKLPVPKRSSTPLNQVTVPLTLQQTLEQDVHNICNFPFLANVLSIQIERRKDKTEHETELDTSNTFQRKENKRKNTGAERKLKLQNKPAVSTDSESKLELAQNKDQTELETEIDTSNTFQRKENKRKNTGAERKLKLQKKPAVGTAGKKLKPKQKSQIVEQDTSCVTTLKDIQKLKPNTNSEKKFKRKQKLQIATSNKKELKGKKCAFICTEADASSCTSSGSQSNSEYEDSFIDDLPVANNFDTYRRDLLSPTSNTGENQIPSGSSRSSTDYDNSPCSSDEPDSPLVTTRKRLRIISSTSSDSGLSFCLLIYFKSTHVL